MLYRPLIVLAEIHFAIGLIDTNEFSERVAVAHWLQDDGNSAIDPRQPGVDEEAAADVPTAEIGESGEFAESQALPTGDSPDWLQLVALGKWYFTRSDPDPYPSTPHGHLNNANRRWPKLNPYTGRAFRAKHQEDPRLRLSKADMRAIWSDRAFREFCRSHVVWYLEAYPQHTFAVTHPLRFPRW